MHLCTSLQPLDLTWGAAFTRYSRYTLLPLPRVICRVKSWLCPLCSGHITYLLLNSY